MRDLHPSKKAAFADGALTAFVITYTVMKLRQGYKQMCAEEANHAVLAPKPPKK